MTTSEITDVPRRAAERQPPVAVPQRLVDLRRLALGVTPQQEPGDPAECARDQQGRDPPRRRCLLDTVLEGARVVAERRVLHVEQDRHHQRAEQAGGDAGQHHHHPEPGGQHVRAVTGDVRLFRGAAAGRHAMLEQRLRTAHALAGPGRPPAPHRAEPAGWARKACLPARGGPAGLLRVSSFTHRLTATSVSVIDRRYGPRRPTRQTGAPSSPTGFISNKRCPCQRPGHTSPGRLRMSE